MALVISHEVPSSIVVEQNPQLYVRLWKPLFSSLKSLKLLSKIVLLL